LTEVEININAFEFVQKLQIVEEFPSSDTEPKLKGSFAHLQSVDLSDNIINSPVIQSQKIHEIGDDKLLISIDGLTYGFQNQVYPAFYKFIYDLSLLNNFYSKVSIRYLRTQTLFWLIDVFRNNKAKQDLLNFLLVKLESDIRRVKYYYPILNLTIEEPFNIGNIRITFFTKEYFDKYWEKSKKSYDSDEATFNSLFRKYQGNVFIESIVEAESRKGQNLSYDLACFASDIIILLSPTIIHPKEECLIDLDKRIPWESEYLSMDYDKEFDFTVSISANRGTFHISKEMVNSIKNNILVLFGKVLRDQLKYDIDYLIVDSIKFIAKAIREADLHLRISLLIMVIESIFLFEDENYRMEKKCKRRMCKLLYPSAMVKYEELQYTLSNMYEIRHKMTHKSIRKYIEPSSLSHFQSNLVEVILQLLSNNSRFKTKDNLISILDSRV